MVIPGLEINQTIKQSKHEAINLLIHKIPPHTEPDLQPRIWITGGSKVIISKAEAALVRYLHGVQIFGPYESLEASYPEMNKG